MRANREWPLRAMVLILGLILGACFMPHGYPPWSGIKTDTVFSLPLDLGELAARLGSIVTYDRRGDVIELFTFDDGIQGAAVSGDHVDSVVSLSTDTALSGPFSLKLDPRGADNAYAQWRKLVFPLTLGRIGAEFAFSLQPWQHDIYFRISYFDGEDYYVGRVTYSPSSGDWVILKAPMAEKTVLEGYKVQTGLEAWHKVKIVIDTEELEYVRLLIDDEVVDVDGIGLWTDSSNALGVIEVRVKAGGSPAAHAPAYLDSVIVTQNEPKLRE